MLQTLDTIIAFAVIMTIVSLLITIVVQMLSAALSLRGKNLANAVSLTFQTIDPKLAEHAHALAEYILKDPIFSDSLAKAKERVAPILDAQTEEVIAAERELQRVTNVAVEAKAAAMRRQAEHAAEPANEQKADAARAAAAAYEAASSHLKSAQDAVAAVRGTHKRTTSAVSAEAKKAPWRFFNIFGTWTLATAIRPGEIYRILHELSSLTPTEAEARGIDATLAQHAGDLIRALGVPDGPASEAQEKLNAIASAAAVFTTETERKAILESAAELSTSVERATAQAYDRFQRWFGSAQDRAEQWFQAHIRNVTVLCAFIAAFGLQLDTIEIFRQLRSDPQLTAALVNAAPAVLEQGKEVLDPGDTVAYRTYLLWRDRFPLYFLKELPAGRTPEAYAEALRVRLDTPPDDSYAIGEYENAFERVKALPASPAPPAAPSPSPSAESLEAAAALAAYDEWAAKFPTETLAARPDAAKATKASVVTALKARLAENHLKAFGTTPAQGAQARLARQAAFDDMMATGAAYLDARQKRFNSLRAQLNETGFDLVPASFWGRWKREQAAHPSRWVRDHPFLAGLRHHLVGMLMTTGLLALGAPFWFNLLKNLMNLRPAIATLIERRPRSSPALPQIPPQPVPRS